MFIKKDLIIKNCNMGCPNMTGVKEEDLGIFAPRVLNDFYRYHHSGLLRAMNFDEPPDRMTRMMAVLPYVAEHYGLDKNDILQNWTSEFGLMHMRNGT